MLSDCVVARLLSLTSSLGPPGADVWFYYSRSLNCCVDLRTILGCSANPDEPCRGFTGYCSDLQNQFTGIQDGMIPPNWTCQRFPVDDSVAGGDQGTMRRDSILVGLISAAIAVPFSVVVAHCFEVSGGLIFSGAAGKSNDAPKHARLCVRCS